MVISLTSTQIQPFQANANPTTIPTHIESLSLLLATTLSIMSISTSGTLSLPTLLSTLTLSLLPTTYVYLSLPSSFLHSDSPSSSSLCPPPANLLAASIFQFREKEGLTLVVPLDAVLAHNASCVELLSSPSSSSTIALSLGNHGIGSTRQHNEQEQMLIPSPSPSTSSSVPIPTTDTIAATTAAGANTSPPSSPLTYTFPCRMITCEVHSSLEAVGFIAVLARGLAEKGISCNVVSGYFHDHLFIGQGREAEAMGVLEALVMEAKREGGGKG